MLCISDVLFLVTVLLVVTGVEEDVCFRTVISWYYLLEGTLIYLNV